MELFCKNWSYWSDSKSILLCWVKYNDYNYYCQRTEHTSPLSRRTIAYKAIKNQAIHLIRASKFTGKLNNEKFDIKP